MQFMVYENTYVAHSADIETIRWETEQHFQRRQASTELQCIEQLALEIMKEYAIWLGMTQFITSQQ